MTNELLLKRAINNKQWADANTYTDNIMSTIDESSGGVNVYNIRSYTPYDTSNIDTWLQSDGAKTLFHVPEHITF